MHLFGQLLLLSSQGKPSNKVAGTSEGAGGTLMKTAACRQPEQDAGRMPAPIPGSAATRVPVPWRDECLRSVSSLGLSSLKGLREKSSWLLAGKCCGAEVDGICS